MLDYFDLSLSWNILFYAVVVELPVGFSHAAASGNHSTNGWVFTHAAILVRMSFDTELLSVSGKWKKLHGLYVHSLLSYAARQQSSVNLLGRMGWGKIGPGCSILVVSSGFRYFRIFLPGSPVVCGCMFAMSPRGFGVPLV